MHPCPSPAPASGSTASEPHLLQLAADDQQLPASQVAVQRVQAERAAAGAGLAAGACLFAAGSLAFAGGGIQIYE